jgi:hypothetical protein
LEPVTPACGQHDARACARRGAGHLHAEAGAGAGDQHDTIGERHVRHRRSRLNSRQLNFYPGVGLSMGASVVMM